MPTSNFVTDASGSAYLTGVGAGTLVLGPGEPQETVIDAAPDHWRGS